MLSANYDIDGIEVVIGASVGIALSPSDGTTGEELMRNADMALYRAKSDGGGVHRFFEREMDRLAQKRRDMEVDLRRAFANGEFELHLSAAGRHWRRPYQRFLNRCYAGGTPTRA